MTSIHPARRRGFTLIELLVTLGIIVLLISILLPVVSRVRKTAQKASVEAELQSISSAIEQYQQTYGAYPGPLSDGQLYQFKDQPAGTPSGVACYTGTQQINPNMTNVTGTENLVLAMMGGIKPIATAPFVAFDAALIGAGPRTLNAANPKRNPPLLDNKIPLTSGYASGPNYGKYRDNAGVAADSEIPEILDLFPSPMPILYLRAKVGAGGVVSIAGQDLSGAVIGPVPTMPGVFIPTQYDLQQILAYTKGKSGSIGEGKSINVKAYKNYGATPGPGGAILPHGLREDIRDDATLDKSSPSYEYPYNALPYLWNRSIPQSDPNATVGGPPGKNMNATGTPKKKDAFILISAGVDRVYGTEDDITNFGSVTE